VKTIRPRLNPHGFVRSVIQPGYVRGFYRADLMSHVAGSVKFLQKNIGDPVTEGEVLLELDVPELVQGLGQREALVRQAEQDARAAEAQVAVITAQDKEAETLVREKQTQVDRAAATKKLREAECTRFKTLVAKNAAVESVLDECVRNCEAAE